ncbi:MAG: diacylglycerol kinase family protein [Bacteroidales bacterium]|nr:diacylglycerol kinase family protein [Bacteroidales bacterium]MCF8337662.1 diacylglycerol kinase family protein [Bacteroidales bacterium]
MNQRFSLKKRYKSFGHAFRGLFYALRTQHNLWIQLALMAIAVALGFVFCITRFEWLAIIGVSGLVLVLEIVNTALETFLDAWYPHHNKTIGKVKDIAAGAVLMGAIAALITGLVIFLPKIVGL